MNERKYLNEEEHQKTVRRLSLISKLMLIIGAIGFIACGILLFGHFISFNRMALVGFAWILFGALFGFGLVLTVIANQRKIAAYTMQESLPIIKEGLEEITPTVGRMAEEISPAAGKVAKEIAKGVKEGLEE